MADPSQPEPAPAEDLPYADDLLSERSRAWVRDRQKRDVEPGGGESGGFQARIAGYNIGRRLGRGGMGTVYACEREGSPERLAIKIITSGKYAAEEERRRFKTEIGVLLRLHHPNLSRLRDFGQDGAVAWFVMDFIDGRQFHHWMRDEKPDYIAIASLLGHAARAIAHAHRQGIVHRDLNPANIMVLADRTPVIMDFGLARDLSSDENLTQTGTAVGTPPYMAPEQTVGPEGVITNRTDIWGLGGILFFALTGRPPFEGSGNHEIFTAINETEVIRPRSLVPAIPADLEGICLRCLQRVTSDRYEDMDELAADLESFTAGRRVGVQLPGIITRLSRRVRRKPLPWALATGLILLALGFGSYAAVEQIRRWASWTLVEDASFEQPRPLPAGLLARDGLLNLLPEQPVPEAGGLRTVMTAAGQAGWWWLERPGLQAGVRVEFVLDTPVSDAIEVAVNAGKDQPREWWHHPSGWAIKVQSTGVLSVSVIHQDRSGPIAGDAGFLLDRGYARADRTHVVVQVQETSCTVRVGSGKEVTVTEPLALGGSDQRAIGIRFHNAKNRLLSLRVERLTDAELVSPLAGPDSLLRHGHNREALAEYLLVAKDHARSELGGRALLRAFGEVSRDRRRPDAEAVALYDQLVARGPGPLLDEADYIRATTLWARGHPALALSVARKLVARRPELNPVRSFLTDRTWTVPPETAPELLRLFASSPPVAGVLLGDLSLEDLTLLKGRPAWTININGNRVSDLSPLSESGATALNASYNRIADLAPLATTKALGKIILYDNLISDLGPLRSLPALAHVDLGYNRVRQLAGLPESLAILNISGNPCAELTGLPVQNLTRVYLGQTAIADLSPLAQAVKLDFLDISETPVRSLAVLAGLSLTDLSISKCRGLDLTGFPPFKLRRLQATGMGLIDPELLRRLLEGGVVTLNLADNQITRWPAIPVPALRELNLSGCQLQDTTGLRSLTGLRILDMRNCGLTSVADLAGFDQLTYLNLCDNKLTSVSALLGKPPTNLAVMGNPLDDAGCRELIEAGRRLKRYDLVAQGASLLVQQGMDPRLLREYAIRRPGRSYAVLQLAKPCNEEEALRQAAAAGGRLAVIPDADVNLLLKAGLPGWNAYWTGLRLRGSQVVDEEDSVAAFVAPIPPYMSRGFRSLPTDGGRIALLSNASWTLCQDGLAAGVVLEWPEPW